MQAKSTKDFAAQKIVIASNFLTSGMKFLRVLKTERILAKEFAGPENCKRRGQFSWNSIARILDIPAMRRTLKCAVINVS